MIRIVRAAALLGALALPLALTACVYELAYDKVSETTHVDPKTGHKIRTTRWRYADGSETTTRDDLTAGGNDTRRTEPPPQLRIFDF